MTQQSSTARSTSKSVPSTGMRGGLGRTLLTALLLLSIVPLSLISFVASTQARYNLRRELKEKLNIVATSTEIQIRDWITHQQLVLALLSNSLEEQSQNDRFAVPDVPAASPTLQPEPGARELTHTLSVFQLYEKIADTENNETTFIALLLLDQRGRVLAAHPPMPADLAFPNDLLEHQQTLLEVTNPLMQSLVSGANQTESPVLMLAQPVAESEWTLVALLTFQSLIQTVSTSVPWSKNSESYLMSPSGQVLKLASTAADTNSTGLASSADEAENQTSRRHSMAVEAALAGQSGTASYKNYQGITVVGAYRWLPELNMALLVEQPQDLALAASDDLAVVLIGAALAVALLTALIAAAVTHRITLPIIQLTATAVQIAAGDLHQKVPTTRRDEIGILARAFNVMTSKLRILYEDLEQKVRERTQQLQKANAEIRYRAMQLAISAEVARVVTSILDREALLARVVELIRDCFQAYFVALFFIDKEGQWATLHKGSGGLGQKLKAEGYRVDLSQDNLISQAANKLEPRVCAGPPLDHCTDRQLFPYTRAELAVPLKIGRRRIGVLDVHSLHEDAFIGDEIIVLETLAGQIAVALENARVYEMEHQAVEQLREVEESRRRFLSNMSRELRMPLNNIIGFSRVILKGIDGPITALQEQDLNAIYDSGQQLLALINDILDIAQIEAGELELAVRPVDLGEIAHSVIPTTNALLEGRPIELRHQISPDLPLMLADPLRIRQVLIKLLSNAAKFTPEGEIALRVWSEDDQVLVSVSDTGIGIPDKYRERVFGLFQQLPQPNPNPQGTGLGLTFSKEIVEMHGGKIWLESKEGQGTTFTIALPILDSSQ